MEKNQKTDEILEGYLEEMKVLTLLITGRLEQQDIPVEALIIEYWPMFKTEQATYNVWDGDKHIMPIGGCTWRGTQLTAYELMEVVERRIILKRKF